MPIRCAKIAVRGILISFLLVGSASPGRSMQGGPKTPEARQAKGSVASAEGDSDTLLRLAEAKAAKAATLRSKQTSKDFAAAVALLQESARLFLAGHWNARAAEAQLQIGELYFASGR